MRKLVETHPDDLQIKVCLAKSLVKFTNTKHKTAYDLLNYKIVEDKFTEGKKLISHLN